MGSWLVSLLSDWKDRFTPYTEWAGELKNPAVLKADVMAGLTSALILVPQSMAYAQLAGLPAYIGLYASFLPIIVAGLFGSSRQLGSGPVALVALMTGTALQP
ncbi:MAG: SulP family inorganic anion transporter, partial [Thiothrix litoralis]